MEASEVKEPVATKDAVTDDLKHNVITLDDKARGEKPGQTSGLRCLWD